MVLCLPSDLHCAECMQYYKLHLRRPIIVLQGVKIVFVAAGAGACHSIIGDEAGRCYTWGRNEVRSMLCHNTATDFPPYCITDVH